VTLHEQVRYRGTLQVTVTVCHTAEHYGTMTETCSAVLRSRRNCSSDGAERTDDGRAFHARAAVSALETFVIIALYKSTFTIPYHTTGKAGSPRVVRRVDGMTSVDLDRSTPKTPTRTYVGS